MDENIALEVGFGGETQIYNPGYKTTWQNLLAMLKCSFDLEDIVVTYIDDEEDEIAVDTEEEYDQAKALAVRCHNVLRLRVYPRDQRTVSETLPKEYPRQPETTEAVKRKTVHTPPRPETATSNQQPDPTLPSSPPIPVPPPRPKVPPRLNRTNSLPAHKQPHAVSGYVMKAVEELKQLNSSTTEQTDGPDKEKELISQIVKGVLDGLGSGSLDKTRPFSWEPSQMLAGSRTPVYSTAQTSEPGTKPKNRTPAKLVHTGVKCDQCACVITGFRYKCGHCLDFDLCEECEALPGVHDPNHVFLKLKRPAYRVGMKSDGRVAPIFKHPIYADDDTPVWEYKIKKLEEKMARKAARAELKRKYREEKRRVRVECHGQVSPTKRERIEKMAEKQAEQIMAAANVAATPTISTTSAAADTTTETTPLLAHVKYDACFVNDGNLPDETHLQPQTKFVKSWIMLNNGNVKWNSDTKLKYLWGDIKVLSHDPMDIPLLSPGEEGPICVDFEAPAKPGHYQSHWRLAYKGEQFGHRVWCNIIVDQAEVLEPKCETKKTVQEELILPKVKENGKVQGEPNENTPSSAVAHLQSDQSDNCSPTRMVSSSDVLTAHDVLSFELLSIHDDHDADKEVAGVNSPAATTTPNNTPIVGLTPCISPVPQLDEKLLCRRVSEHSDLEIIHKEDIPEIIETLDTVKDGPSSEMAQEGVAVASSFSDNEDDVESICSSSDSDMLDDYCVVPLPDCFDPSKPLDKSLILSRTSLSSSVTSSILRPSAENTPLVRLPSYEESQAEIESNSVSEDSTTPQASTPVIITERVPQFTAAAEDNTSPAEEQDAAKMEEIIQMEEVQAQEKAIVAPSVDAILSTSNPALETTPLIPLLAATPVEQQATPIEQQCTPVQEQVTICSPKPTNPNHETVAMAPMPEITLLASPVSVPTQSEEGVLINPEGSVVYSTKQPEVVRETCTTPGAGAAVGTNLDLIETSIQTQEPQVERERQEEHDDEFHDAQDVPTEHENLYNDVQVEADPVDLLGYTAARAVEVAGSVVRQAFDTAASSMNALLRPQPIPMPAPYKPPSPSPMDQLIEMGFGDRTKNQELLEKHNDDVSRCVQDLLHAEDNDWSNNRH